MTRIILIRHAPTIPDPDQPSSKWHLSEDSEALCQQLAEKICAYNIAKIYSSVEMKAQSTATYITKALGHPPMQIVHDIEETRRLDSHFYESQEAFQDAVQRAMESPDALLFGAETFSSARERFTTQLEQLVQNHLDETIAIVSHGRILSMYLADIMELSPVVIWHKLKMPAYAVFAWQEQKVEQIIYQIEGISDDG